MINYSSHSFPKQPSEIHLREPGGGEQHREPGLGVQCHNSSCLSHEGGSQMMSSPEDLNHANASDVILPACRSWTWRGVSVAQARPRS
jgi:hypothetical protein